MGSISVDPEVIAQFAGNVADECLGIVGMAAVNSKEGFANLLKKESMTKGISVTLNSRDKLVIDFHVIVAYGVNIMAVADNLVSSVAYRVEDFTGLEVEKINVEMARELRIHADVLRDTACVALSDGAFAGCSSLERITLPKGIGSSPLSGLDGGNVALIQQQMIIAPTFLALFSTQSIQK